MSEGREDWIEGGEDREWSQVTEEERREALESYNSAIASTSADHPDKTLLESAGYTVSKVSKEGGE